MRKEIETYELIERYISDKLNPAERVEVEQMIASDSEFRLELEKHQKLHNLLIDRSLVDIKEKLQSIHTKHSINAKPNFIKGKTILLIGSLIIIAFISSLILMSPFQKETTKIPVETSSSTKSSQKEDTISEITKDKTPELEITEPTKIKRTSSENQSTKGQPNDTISSPPVDKELIHEELETKHLDPISTENPIELEGSDIHEVEKNELKQEAALAEDVSPDEIDCSEVIITADISTEPSCDNKPSGKIIIDKESIKGGTDPYTTSISNNNSFVNKTVFDNLYAKMYSVSIKDSEGCITILGNFIVNSLDCSYEYAFAPEKGEVWEIPTQGSTGNIKIYNKQGLIVYQQEFDYPGTYEWYGRSINGQNLPMSIYIFVLELDDADNMYGNVTIIR